MWSFSVCQYTLHSIIWHSNKPCKQGNDCVSHDCTWYRHNWFHSFPPFLTRTLTFKFFNDVAGTHLYYRLLNNCKRVAAPVQNYPINGCLLTGLLLGRQFGEEFTMHGCGPGERSVQSRQCVFVAMFLVFRWHRFLRLDCSGSKQFCEVLDPLIYCRKHTSISLYLVGTTLAEYLTAIHHSLPAPGRPTTLSALVQLARVFQMTLQGMIN